MDVGELNVIVEGFIGVICFVWVVYLMFIKGVLDYSFIGFFFEDDIYFFLCLNCVCEYDVFEFFIICVF